jgi:hypothetical protein
LRAGRRDGLAERLDRFGTLGCVELGLFSVARRLCLVVTASDTQPARLDRFREDVVSR